MVEIASFYTAQTQSQKGSPSPSGASVSGQPGALGGGLSFVDFMLTRILEAQQAGEAVTTNTGGGNQLLQSDNPALASNTSLDPAQLIESDLSGLSEIEQSLVIQIEDALKGNQDALNNLAQQFDGETVVDQIESFLTSEPIDLIQASEALTDIIQVFAPGLTLQDIVKPNQGAPGIAINLTPAQAADLQAALQRAEETGEALEIPAGLAFALVKIAPPPQSQPELVALITPQDLGQVPGAGRDLIAQLTPLLQGRSSFGLPDGFVPLSDGELTFGQALQAASGKADTPITPQAPTPASPVIPSTDGALSALQGWPFENQGSLLAGLQSFAWGENGFEAVGQSYQFQGLSQFTNIALQAQSAAQPHPGTAVVAAAITKGAASGENSSLLIQLDPPELGRVEVRMEFGKDKSVKALLTIEKPETFAMLQRDVQSLERALQEAGMDVDSSSLSFEMAGDDGFSHDGSHDGSRNAARGPDGADSDGDDIDIIETTMTWHVDPETGHTRYDILA